MAYTDIGFNEFLTRDFAAPSQQQNSQELDPLQFDSLTQQISATKLQGGIIASADGKLQINLDEGIFKINNGIEELINFGVLSDGSVGLVIKDSKGNILMKVAEGEFYLESPLKTSRIDLITDQYTIKDERQELKILIGRDEGGF